MTAVKIFFLGGLGALLRWGVTQWLPMGVYPWGTLAVNALGSFLIGYLYGVYGQQGPVFNSADLHWAIMVGFLGGLTTFSTFSLELLRYFQNYQWVALLSYLVASLVLGVGLCWLGFRWSF